MQGIEKAEEAKITTEILNQKMKKEGWGSWERKLVTKISEQIKLVFQHVEFEVTGKHPVGQRREN